MRELGVVVFSQPLFQTTTAECPVISSQCTFLGASSSPL